jgi:hypothetical protein
MRGRLQALGLAVACVAGLMQIWATHRSQLRPLKALLVMMR